MARNGRSRCSGIPSSWVRLHENGGTVHEMPGRHNLDEYVHAHLQTAAL